MSAPSFKRDSTRPHVVVAADSLNERQIRQVMAAADGWASCERVSQESPDLPEKTKNADILVGWADAVSIREGRVQTYLCGSAGYDAYVGRGLDTKPGFRHCTAGTTMSATIAEHCVALMFALVRQIHTIVRQQSGHQWQRRWNAGEVSGAKACVVGLGGSGTELARRLAALGLRLCGVRKNAGQGHEIVREIYPPERLEEALSQADHVFCVLPGGPGTRRLFDTRAFQSMKRGSFFYSASRGSVTDEAALIEALRRGHLGGAGLDVFETEPLPPSSALWDMENVIVSPHSAGLSEQLGDRLAEWFAGNLRNLREGRPLHGEIDVQLLR